MPLSHGERELLASNDGSLVLTDRRVRFDGRVGWDRRLVEIPLDAVTACGLVQRTPEWPGRAVLGLVVLQGRLGLRPVEVLTLIGVAVAATFSRRTVALEIHAGGRESIRVSAKSMKREDALAFIDALEGARSTAMVGSASPPAPRMAAPAGS